MLLEAAGERLPCLNCISLPCQDLNCQEEEDPMNKLKGQKIVSCRICKGDHWTTRCPYKDTLGPMQKELAEQLGLSTGEKEKLPGGARTLGYGWQAWGLGGGVGVEHRNCVRLWESWVLTWGLDRTTTVGGYYLPHSSKAVATAHVGLCERLQVGALLVAPPVSLSGFVRASSEHCCRCKDIASSEGRRLFSQCVCPDWSLLCWRTCAHTHTHTHTLEFYTCDSCAQPLVTCPRDGNLGAVATLCTVLVCVRLGIFSPCILSLFLCC